MSIFRWAPPLYETLSVRLSVPKLVCVCLCVSFVPPVRAFRLSPPPYLCVSFFPLCLCISFVPFLFMHFVHPPCSCVSFAPPVRAFHSSPPPVFIINQICLCLLHVKSLHGGVRWHWVAHLPQPWLVLKIFGYKTYKLGLS